MIEMPIIREFHPFLKLISLALIIICTLLIVTLTGLVLAMPFFGIDILDVFSEITNYQDPKNVAFLKYMQIISQIGMFILPALLFVFLTGNGFLRYMQLNRIPGLKVVLISFILIFTLLPFINWLGILNSNITFPESWAWFEQQFRTWEDDAALLTEAFLSTTSVGGLLINLFMIGLMAALGEEFIFRGIVLRLFKEWSGNIHVAVIVSALLFSCFHLQFFGLFPRFILGVVLGYLFVWTKSLWVPIFFHFTNNAMAVLVGFLATRETFEIDYESFGSSDLSSVVLGSLILSLVLMGLVLYFEKVRHKKRKHLI